MGSGSSCLPSASASRNVLPQGALPAQGDNAFHQLRMARLNRYLTTVSRKPEAFVQAVERRRQEQEGLVDSVSLRGLPGLLTDEPAREEG